MIEWMEYPIGLTDLDEEVTITWSDGSQDVVPGHDGDGETIYQLPNLMEEIFTANFYHLWEFQEGKSFDETAHHGRLFADRGGEEHHPNRPHGCDEAEQLPDAIPDFLVIEDDDEEAGQ